MSKSTYSEAEIQQILHQLFIEKKKVQELTQRVVFLSQGEEKAAMPQAMIEPQEDALILKSQIDELQHSLKKAQEEILDYQQKLMKQEIKEQFEDSSKKQKPSFERLALLLQEKEKKIQELQQYEYSYKKAHEQRQIQQVELDELNQNLRRLDEEKRRLERLCEEQRQYIDELQIEYRSLQERSEALQADRDGYEKELQEERVKLEIKTEELREISFKNDELDRFLSEERIQKSEIDEELANLYEQFELLKSQVAETKASLEYREAALEESNLIIERLKSEKQQAEFQFAQEKESLVQRQVHDIDNLNQQIALLTEEKQKLEEELRISHSDHNEQDQRLKVAQLHLGKKVKETALLTEKIEEQQKLIDDLENNLSLSNSKIHDLSLAIEQQNLQEAKLQNQLSESLKSIETQISKWEAKYFQMHEKWQEADAKCRELKTYEEKYKQLQALFSNVGQVMNGINCADMKKQGPLQMTPQPIKRAFPVIENHPEDDTSITEPTNENSLFDIPMSAAKVKNSLFD